MLHFKSPLSWPDSMPTTPLAKQRNDNSFSQEMPIADAINFLKEEIETLNIQNAILYTDIEQPHVIRLSKKIGSRTGACLHINHYNKSYIITCDRWQRLEHNIYAMHLVLRQWNNMELWGVGSLPKLMAGFEIEYSANNDHQPNYLETNGIFECLKAFGLGSTATLDDATAIYHRRAKTFAQQNDKLVQLNLQMDEIRSYFANKKTE